MQETKNLLDTGAAGLILIKAVSIPEGLLDEILRVPDPENYKAPVVEVKLTVNGIEVPFTQAVNEAFEYWEREFDKYVLEKAEKLIVEAHLSDIECSLNELKETVECHSWSIRRKLEAATKE